MGLLGSWLLILLGLSPAFAESTRPSLELGISLQPQDLGFTQKLSGVRFEPNAEGLVTQAFSILARYNQDETRFFELEHTETLAQIGGLNTSVFNVRDSKISLGQTLLRGFDCAPGDLDRQRFCWGVELGTDALPVLQFEDPVTLAMDEAESYILGPSATFQFPASFDVTLHLKAWTYFGIGGQNTERISLKSDWKFGAQAGAIQKWDGHNSASFTMDYYIRQAKIETPHQSGSITWNVIYSAVVFHGAYIFSF